jgi:CRP/FNR family transcriptional regulator, cyclic AMP receptor protein
VIVRVSTPDGEQAILGLRDPGEVVGELALIGTPAPRSATALALEPTETRAISRSDFQELLSEQPHVAQVLVRILADRVRDLGSGPRSPLRPR